MITSGNFINENEFGSLNQILSVVVDLFMHAKYHPWTNWLVLVHSCEFFDFKELQHVFHIFIINHKSSVRQHIEIKKKLDQFFLSFSNNTMANWSSNNSFLIIAYNFFLVEFPNSTNFWHYNYHLFPSIMFPKIVQLGANNFSFPQS